jgi:Rrf2 family nitric oxide-sensitive transcriptional repressor
VRASETDFRLVECFDPQTSRCTLTPSCRLKGVFDAALRAYFKELDGVTLADIVEPSSAPGSGRTVSLRRRTGAAPIASPKSLRRTRRTGTSDA